MSIEKKSLISNRMASKKAIVTKPEVSKVSSPRATVKSHLTLPNTRMTIPNTRTRIPNTRMTVPNTKVKF